MRVAVVLLVALAVAAQTLPPSSTQPVYQGLPQWRDGGVWSGPAVPGAVPGAEIPQQSLSGITAEFTWQHASFGPLQLYAVNVCNQSPMNATVQAYRDVWPLAKKQNLQLQTPTAIREVERNLEGGDWPKWVLWGSAGGCAIAAAVTNSGVVSLDPSKGVGKVVAYGTAGCAIALPVVAERWTGRPGGDQVKAPEGEMLVPVFILAAGDCKQGLVYATVPFGLRVAP